MLKKYIRIFLLVIFGAGVGAFSYLVLKDIPAKREIYRLKKTLRNSPENIEERHRLGLLYMYEGDLKKAEEEFLAVLSVDPYNRKALRSLGMVYYKKGEPHKSLTYWRTLLEIEPDNQFIWNLVNEMSNGRGGEKIAHENTLPLNPDWEKHYRKGKESYQKKDFRNAVEEFKKALAFNPADFRTYFNIGASYYAMRDLKKAKEMWEAALKYKKDDILTMKLISLVEYDIARGKNIEDLKKRLKKEPQKWELHAGLADAYLKDRMTIKDAEREYLEALRLNPGHAPSYENLIMLSVKIDDYDKAIYYAKKRLSHKGGKDPSGKKKLDSLLSYKKFMEKGKHDWEAKGLNFYAEMAPVSTNGTVKFYIDKYEVTNAQYQAFLEASNHAPPLLNTIMNQSMNQDDGSMNGKENYPVTGVNWYDALSYCKWAGKRLPTEEEWIKAGWGENPKNYPWGDNFDINLSNTMESGFEKPTPVGSYAPDYNIHDMAGNVAEWTSGEKMLPGGEAYKIRKGGSFLTDPKLIRPDARWSAPPTHRDNATGFRCVK